MNQSREIDLLHGPLLSSLIRFALPIAMSSMLQQRSTETHGPHRSFVCGAGRGLLLCKPFCAGRHQSLRGSGHCRQHYRHKL